MPASTPRCCGPASTGASRTSCSCGCRRSTAAPIASTSTPATCERREKSNERLDGLAGWRESPYFTDAEKAALEWAESLTHVDLTHAPDAAYAPLAQHFDDKTIANITYAIALMNAWNRIAIGFQKAPVPRPAK